MVGFMVLTSWDNFALAGAREDAAKALDDLKNGKDTKTKVDALDTLAKLGQIQKSLITAAVPEMMKSLEHKEASIRAAGAKAVGMIDPDAKEVVPIFLKMVKEDKDENVKLGAIQGLGYMGNNAKAAIPDLKKIVKDEDKKSKLGRAAQQALRVITPKKN
ncbi:MAG: HEAT repeat domain-containing protein [Fimbriiglobus sp.]